MTENDDAQQAMGQAQRDTCQDCSHIIDQEGRCGCTGYGESVSALVVNQAALIKRLEDEVERLNKRIELIEGSRKSLQALLRELADINEKMDKSSRFRRWTILKPLKGETP